MDLWPGCFQRLPSNSRFLSNSVFTSSNNYSFLYFCLVWYRKQKGQNPSESSESKHINSCVTFCQVLAALQCLSFECFFFPEFLRSAVFISHCYCFAIPKAFYDFYVKANSFTVQVTSSLKYEVSVSSEVRWNLTWAGTSLGGSSLSAGAGTEFFSLFSQLCL